MHTKASFRYSAYQWKGGKPRARGGTFEKKIQSNNNAQTRFHYVLCDPFPDIYHALYDRMEKVPIDLM